MSPVPGFGHNSYIIFGTKETTFDTFAAPTNGKKHRLLAWEVEPVIGSIPDDTLHGQLSRFAISQGLSYFKGTFTVRLNYDGLLEFFRASMGTGISDGAAMEVSVRDHRFREASSATALGEVLNSYSGEVSWGDIPTGKVWRMTGVKFLGWTIRVTAGTGNEAMATVQFNIWGRRLDTNSGAGQDPTTSGVTTPAALPVLFSHPSYMAAGNATAFSSLRVQSVEVAYMPPHDEERAYLGSLYPDEPIRSGPIAPTWKIVHEFNNMADWEAARAFSDGALQLIFAHPTNLATHTSSACTPQAGNTITRGTGSFSSDGWVIGDHVDPSTVDTSIALANYVTNVAALTLTTSRVNTLGASQTVTGGVRREVELKTGTAKLKSLSTPISAYGKLISTSQWEGIYNATDFASLMVRIRNTEAALA